MAHCRLAMIIGKACNGINAGKNIELQTVAWLLQACNGLLQLNNESLQVNNDIDVVNNVSLQAGNGGDSTSKGCCTEEICSKVAHLCYPISSFVKSIISSIASRNQSQKVSYCASSSYPSEA
jgi:hypothetical protein